MTDWDKAMKIQDEAVAGAVAMGRLAERCRAAGLDPDVAVGRAKALMSETPFISTDRAIQLSWREITAGE